MKINDWRQRIADARAQFANFCINAKGRGFDDYLPDPDIDERLEALERADFGESLKAKKRS